MRHPFCKLCERLHHSACRRDDIGLNPACAKILTHGHYPLNLGSDMFSEQILSGFHEGVKALRLGVGKHLFAAHSKSWETSAPCKADMTRPAMVSSGPL